MPSWARRQPKLFYLGMGGGVVGGAMGGLLYHIIDPPRTFIMAIEAVLAVTVLLLAIPHSPQTPNLNLIPQLTNAH